MDKMQKLEGILKDMGAIMVAYSGGVDSSLLLYVAGKVLGDKVVAGTVVSPLYTDREIETSRSRASHLGVKQVLLEMNLFSNKEVVTNPPQRCYHCKLTVFTLLMEEASRLGLGGVVDATHADDLTDFRPGLLALMELGIRSPLSEAGFHKEDIRRYARIYNLPGADDPSSPCLATRIPFGRPITLPALQRVAAAEEYLASLGFKVCRVRDHFPAALIEVPDSEVEKISTWPMRRDIYRHIKQFGYKYVTVDLEGYRRGSQSEILKETEKVKKKI